MDDNNPIIDVDYREFTDDILTNEDVHKEPMYYNCMQVAKKLNEPDSRIRYWSKVFQPVLNITISNNIRKYTDTDIQNLAFIKKLLKEDGLTIKQALDYCENKGFDETNGLVDTSNPLAIKAFIAAMSEEFQNKIDDMQKNMLLQQQTMMEHYLNVTKENNEILKEDLTVAVDNVVSEKLDVFSQDIMQKLDNTELEVNKRLGEIDDKLKLSMENRKKENLEHSKKSHWWQRILHK